MVIYSTNLEALAGESDSPLKARRAMLTRAAVEVDSLEADTHLLDLVHAGMDLRFRIDIIAELSREGSR